MSGWAVIVMADGAGHGGMQRGGTFARRSDAEALAHEVGGIVRETKVLPSECPHLQFTTRTLPYDGGARNQMAAGNVTFVRECVCGCTRRDYVNGSHEEIGKWI